MHKITQNLINLENQLKSLKELSKIKKIPKIIAVSKTFNLEKIQPLIQHGHIDFGENKVQEALNKWSEIKDKNSNIQLHMIGKLQTNKVKFAIKIFDYIHSVDSEKLAKKIFDEQIKIKKRVKIFIQINIGGENQKSGVRLSELKNLVNYCKELKLNLIGLMCIPPEKGDCSFYFKEMSKLNNLHNLEELSMGMSSDFVEAAQNNSTFLRIGSNIFGQRS